MSRTVSILTASSNSGFQCLQDLLAYRGDLNLKVKAAFRTEARANEYMGKLKADADKSKVDVVLGVDALKKESLTDALAGSDMAVLVTPHDPSATFARDSEMCLNMVEAAVASGTVKHIVYVGSWTVVAPDQVKAIAARFVPTEERLAKLGGNPTFTSLRSGFFNQNFAGMMGGMAKEGKISWPNVKIPSVDPRDMGSVAAAICTTPTFAATHGGKHYQICGPAVMSSAEVVAEISQGLGKEIAYEEVPLAAFLDKIPFPPIREIFEGLQANPDLIPFSKDTELVTGKPARALRDWVKENPAPFQ